MKLGTGEAYAAVFKQILANPPSRDSEWIVAAVQSECARACTDIPDPTEAETLYQLTESFTTLKDGRSYHPDHGPMTGNEVANLLALEVTKGKERLGWRPIPGPEPL